MPSRLAARALAGNPYEQVGTCPITKLPIRRWMAAHDLRLIEAVLVEVGDGATWEPLRHRRAQLSKMLEASR